MTGAPLLEVEDIQTFYGDFQALFGISMRIEPGQIVAVIGSNGAGKSTLLKTIVGMLRAAGKARVPALVGDSIVERPCGPSHRRKGHRDGAGGAPAFFIADG